MENLASLLEEGHSPHSRSLSDDHLREEVGSNHLCNLRCSLMWFSSSFQAAVLRSQYMRKQENQVVAGIQSLSIAAGIVRKTLKKVCSDYNSIKPLLCKLVKFLYSSSLL